MNSMDHLPPYYRRKEKRFVDKLWDLVENPELDDAIRWSREGVYVVVPSMTAFEERVLKIYFKTKHFSSFIRQLHMYGFHKRTQDVEVPTTGAYHFEHRLFVRGKANQLVMVQRPPPKWRRSERIETVIHAAAAATSHVLATTAFSASGSGGGGQQSNFLQQSQLLQSFAAKPNGVTATFSGAFKTAPEMIRRGQIVYDYPGQLEARLYGKENRLPPPPPPRPYGCRLPALVLLAEICAAIRKMGQHPDTEEERRKCIEIASLSIQSKRRQEPGDSGSVWIVQKGTRPEQTALPATTIRSSNAAQETDDDSDEPSNLVIDVEK